MNKLYVPNYLLYLCLGFAFVAYSKTAAGQVISVSTTASATGLVTTLVDPSVTISNVTENCKSAQRGTFSNGGGIGMNSGIVLTSGKAVAVIGPNAEGCASETADNVINGNYPIYPETDADLQKLDASNPDLYDICKLEFDFKVNADTLQITYVFGSEEYTAYSKNGAEVNDLFGFFISGNEYTTPRNFALLPGSANYVGIKNVNQRAGSNTYYVVNCPKASAQPGGIQYNGYTKVLTSKVKITPNLKYHIKIAVADASDDIIDSGVLIKAASFAVAVPVTLLHFTTEAMLPDKIRNRITWATASEANSNYFEVLRSHDGYSFSPLYKCSAQGNSSAKHSYEFTDEHPLSGMNYYRLHQVDLDGKESYSSITSIRKHLEIKVESIYPNPLAEKALISVDMPVTGQATVSVLDITGKTILSNTYELTEGANAIELETESLQKGSYFLQVAGNGYKQISRVIK